MLHLPYLRTIREVRYIIASINLIVLVKLWMYLKKTIIDEIYPSLSFGTVFEIKIYKLQIQNYLK